MVTPSNPLPPTNNFCLYPPPVFRCFWKDPLMTPTPHHPTSSILHCAPLPIHHPSPPKNFDRTHNKDAYSGITLLPTLCKIYEMVLLNRLEKFAEQQGLFSNMEFGFKEGVGCAEASFTILESINHMLERGSKVFGCFFDVRKAFDTIWIMATDFIY